MMDRRSAGWALLVASLLALIMSVWSGIQTQVAVRCQATVNEAQVASQRARAAAAEQDRQADRAESTTMAELIHDVFSAKTQAEVQRAYATYTANMSAIADQRAAAEAQRKANPLPPLPSETCG